MARIVRLYEIQQEGEPTYRPGETYRDDALSPSQDPYDAGIYMTGEGKDRGLVMDWIDNLEPRPRRPRSLGVPGLRSRACTAG